MAPSADHFLHYTKDGALSLALVLINGILLSAAILVYCSFCKKKTADLTNNGIQKERLSSELKKIKKIPEQEINGRMNGGSAKNRVLPLPPVSLPQEDGGSLYEELDQVQSSNHQAANYEPNEKHLASTPGSPRAVNGGDVHNPELLENINPLYVPIQGEWNAKTPENHIQMSDIPSEPNQPNETTKEPTNPSQIANEPIYAIVRKGRTSVKNSPVNENVPKDFGVKIEEIQDGVNHKNTDSVTAPTNLVIPTTSSFKLNTILNHWKKKSFKNSTPQPMVSINIDLEEPPPVPDKLFDIAIEANSEENHPKEDNTGTDFELEVRPS